MPATAVNIHGNDTAIMPIFVTNATTSNHIVSFRIDNKLVNLPPIRPGQQVRIFTGTREQVIDVKHQLDLQGYVDLATAISNGADVFYTIEEPTSVDKISQIVEKEQANDAKELEELAETRLAVNKSASKQRLKSENSGLQSIEIKKEEA